MLGLIKQGSDNVLYYTLFSGDNPPAPGTWASMDVALTDGFSSFCAVSEAQNVGDPERVHLVYIKSTGELCYRKFENDMWSSELVLVESGASYPVIACGEGGKLYVFYVKDGVIKMQKLLNINGVVLIVAPERTLFPKHNYRNPAYLSSNQNVQNDKICLVWTEGFESPYEVWFAYLEDR